MVLPVAFNSFFPYVFAHCCQKLFVNTAYFREGTFGKVQSMKREQGSS